MKEPKGSGDLRAKAKTWKAKLMSVRFWKKFAVNYRFHRGLGTISRWRSSVEDWRSARARSPQGARHYGRALGNVGLPSDPARQLPP